MTLLNHASLYGSGRGIVLLIESASSSPLDEICQERLALKVSASSQRPTMGISDSPAAAYPSRPLAPQHPGSRAVRRRIARSDHAESGPAVMSVDPRSHSQVQSNHSHPSAPWLLRDPHRLNAGPSPAHGSDSPRIDHTDSPEISRAGQSQQRYQSDIPVEKSRPTRANLLCSHPSLSALWPSRILRLPCAFSILAQISSSSRIFSFSLISLGPLLVCP